MPYWRLKFIILFILFSIFVYVPSSQAKEATIFDVRRPISMENDEVPPKDFYINAGSNDGLKVGMIINVIRRQALYDVYQNKSPGDLEVSVGQIRLIHVQGEMSVARLETIFKRDELPTLEFDAIMIGDKADLSSGKMAPRKTASLEIPSAPAASDVMPKIELRAPPQPGQSDFSSVAPQAPLETSAPM